MSRKKVSTTIYITPEQADRLKLLHERTKVPISVYIREGIDMMLKHYEHVLPGQMSLEAAASAGVSSLPLPPAGRVSTHPPDLPGPAGSDGGSAAPRSSPKLPAATLRTGSSAHAVGVGAGAPVATAHAPSSRVSPHSPDPAGPAGAASQVGPTRSGDSGA